MSATSTTPAGLPDSMLQMRSLVTADGTLHLSLEEVPVPVPAADEVVVRVGAAPINPSDLGLLLAGADLRAAATTGHPERPVVTAPIPPAALAALALRTGQSLPVGNEGGGTVVAAGSDPAARALLGRVVGTLGGSMYAQYRCVPASMCLPLPEGVTAEQAASCFVNPLTALGMVETMRLEGHRALVHTAAASNLGQMLNRICRADGVPLVNIVRRPEHAELLRSQGALHVCDSSSPTFTDDLTSALVATGATIAFDAVGGGPLAGQILAAMEAALMATASSFNRYGTTTHKQVYVYGGLDRGPTTFSRSFGMAWGIGGWLLMPFLQRVGQQAADALRRRVAEEITTTFASHYTERVTLAGALDLETMRRYARMRTGEKVLITPNG